MDKKIEFLNSLNWDLVNGEVDLDSNDEEKPQEMTLSADAPIFSIPSSEKDPPIFPSTPDQMVIDAANKGDWDQVVEWVMECGYTQKMIQTRMEIASCKNPDVVQILGSYLNDHDQSSAALTDDENQLLDYMANDDWEGTLQFFRATA